MDILHMEHHQSNKRDRMSLEGRAAQFMPFAALTGYDDLVEETARITNDKKELSEDQLNTINEVLAECKRIQTTKPMVELTYFEPDLLKSGGEYIKTTEKLLSVETEKRKIVLESAKKISIADIYDIKIV